MGKTPPGNHLGTRRGLLFLPSRELEGPGIEVAESLRQRFAGLPLSHPTDPYGLTVVESYSSSLALAFGDTFGAAGLGAGATVVPEELDDFFDSLTTDQFTKIRQFFETMPQLKHTVTYSCTTCGEEKTTEVRGLNSFFG